MDRNLKCINTFGTKPLTDISEVNNIINPVWVLQTKQSTYL
jgi:hypothetical protein